MAEYSSITHLSQMVDGPTYKIYSAHLKDNFNAIISALGDRLRKTSTGSTQTVVDTVAFTGGIQTDTISEKTSAAGVTIDGLLIKDGTIEGLSPTGAVTSYVGSSAPTGWVLLNGGTIGNASSGGTTRANDDTEDLFTLLWDSMADAEAAVSSGRGASAAADFAANKTITLPDSRGRVLITVDGSAGIITSSSTDGANADTLGGKGGTQTHQLTTTEMPAHNHDIYYQTSATGGGAKKEVSPFSGSAGSENSSNEGGGAAHSNTQPWLALNYIIKL